MTYQYKSNTLLFCDPEIDQQAIDGAKDYIKNQGYTAEQVKIVKRDGCVLVVMR